MNTARRSIDGRWLALAVVALYAVAFTLAARTRGYDRTLDEAGAPPMGAPFADLYVFPAAARSAELGGNPYLVNPFDPWGRPYNYPRLWLSFMRYPPGAVPALGVTLDLVWLLCLGIAWGRLSPFAGVVGGLLAVAPASVLGLERANSDLIIFVLLTGALVLYRRLGSAPAWVLIFTAGVLKLFPFGAMILLVRSGWRRARWWILGGAVGGSLWFEWKWAEIHAALQNTPAGGPGISYGSTVALAAADTFRGAATGDYAHFSRYQAAAIAMAAFLGAAMALLGAKGSAGAEPADEGSPAALDGFRVGAAIYAVTFIAGSNFDYRRIFLYFCLPWLWPGRPGPWRTLRALGLACIFIGAWSNTYWSDGLDFLREGAAWIAFALLAYLLGATLPPFKPAGALLRPKTGATASP